MVGYGYKKILLDLAVRNRRIKSQAALALEEGRKGEPKVVTPALGF